MDILVVAVGKLEVPVDQFLVHLHPFLAVHLLHQLHADFAELLLVAHCAPLALQAPAFGVLLDGEENLVGVDGLDEVVADFASQGILHDVLLFALGDHYYRQLRPVLFDFPQGVDTRQPRHLFVEEDDIGHMAFQLVEGIAPRLHGNHIVAFLFEEEDVRLQQLNLVVGP